MLRLNQRQRSVLVEKLPDAANLAIGGLLFGQFVGGRVFSHTVALFGVAAWIVFLGSSLLLARKD